MTAETLALITEGRAKKGDVLGVARLAGIMAAKRTADLIPLCHPLPLTKVALDLTPDPPCPASRIEATVKTSGQTGVEMEALTAVSVAALTVYDMVKAVEKSMVIDGIRLILKDGGKSGRYEAKLMISVEEALARCLALAAPLAGRDRAAGRRPPAAGCAPRPWRTRDQPPFAASAMDGYAVQGDRRARRQLCRDRRGRRRVMPFDGAVGPGQAVRIFTGAPVPEGATRVIIQEDVTRRRATASPLSDRRRYRAPTSARRARISGVGDSLAAAPASPQRSCRCSPR